MRRRVCRAGNHPVCVAQMHHHRAKIGDIVQLIAGINGRHPFMFSQFVQRLRVQIQLGRIVRIDDFNLIKIKFNAQLCHTATDRFSFAK